MISTLFLTSLVLMAAVIVTLVVRYLGSKSAGAMTAGLLVWRVCELDRIFRGCLQHDHAPAGDRLSPRSGPGVSDHFPFQSTVVSRSG
jgi:hypothetical protein